MLRDILIFMSHTALEVGGHYGKMVTSFPSFLPLFLNAISIFHTPMDSHALINTHLDHTPHNRKDQLIERGWIFHEASPTFFGIFPLTVIIILCVSRI